MNAKVVQGSLFIHFIFASGNSQQDEEQKSNVWLTEAERDIQNQCRSNSPVKNRLQERLIQDLCPRVTLCIN